LRATALCLRRLQDESHERRHIGHGCVLMALGMVMLANRSGYLYFVVGPRSVLILAGVVAVLAFWIHGAVPR
jgi:hypothetical protein